MAMTNEAVITAILANPTIKAAAASLKCSESAIYKRLKDREFKEELRERRTLLLEEAMNVLQGRMLEAVEIIADIMSNEEASPQTRLNAAESIIRNAVKLSDQSCIENNRQRTAFERLFDEL